MTSMPSTTRTSQPPKESNEEDSKPPARNQGHQRSKPVLAVTTLDQKLAAGASEVIVNLHSSTYAEMHKVPTDFEEEATLLHKIMDGHNEALLAALDDEKEAIRECDELEKFYDKYASMVDPVQGKQGENVTQEAEYQFREGMIMSLDYIYGQLRTLKDKVRTNLAERRCEIALVLEKSKEDVQKHHREHGGANIALAISAEDVQKHHHEHGGAKIADTPVSCITEPPAGVKKPRTFDCESRFSWMGIGKKKINGTGVQAMKAIFGLDQNENLNLDNNRGRSLYGIFIEHAHCVDEHQMKKQGLVYSYDVLTKQDRARKFLNECNHKISMAGSRKFAKLVDFYRCQFYWFFEVDPTILKPNIAWPEKFYNQVVKMLEEENSSNEGKNTKRKKSLVAPPKSPKSPTH